jgi:membrane protein implicated in regulation of membrane protease activity
MDWLRESQWLIWLGAALGAGLAEMLSLDFFFLMLAGGGLAAAGTAAFGGSFPLQVLVFASVSAVLLVTVRPPLKRWSDRSTPLQATGTTALVGREARTITEVTTSGGQVKLAGEVWTARAAPGSLPLEPHTIARVVAIDGATAVVEYRRPPAAAGEITGPDGGPGSIPGGGPA